MVTKLALYNEDLNGEIFSIYVDSNGSNKFNTILQLRSIAKDNSINGWINEYDLEWSNVHCANKHEL